MSDAKTIAAYDRRVEAYADFTAGDLPHPTLLGFVKRVRDPNERLLVVAHEGTIAIAVSHLLGIEPNPWAPLRFTIAWTGLARLRTAQIGSGVAWTLDAFNQTEHLRNLDAPRDGRAPRSVT